MENPKKFKMQIIFVHIPKAAGMSLYNIIDRHYDQSNIFTANYFVFSNPLEVFKDLSIEKRAQLQVMRGHIGFGWHRYLAKDCVPYYITILRDSVDRIISWYYYILSTPKHYLYSRITSKSMGLEDLFLSKATKELDNFQTRMLSGLEMNKNIPFGQTTTEMLEIAKKNIKERFKVVGLAERFNETLILLKRTFEWSDIYYLKSNVTKNRPTKEEISKDLIELINKYNMLDIELYEYAKENFEDQIRKYGPSFKEDLKNFQLQNKLWQEKQVITNEKQKIISGQSD